MHNPTFSLFTRAILSAWLCLGSWNLAAQDFNCQYCNVPMNAPSSAHTNPQCPFNKNHQTKPAGNMLPSMSKQELVFGIISAIADYSARSDEQAQLDKQRKDWENQMQQQQLAQQMAALKKINDSIAQSRHEQMMKEFKKLKGSTGTTYKSLNNTGPKKTNSSYPCTIDSYKGEVLIVKSNGQIYPLTRELKFDLVPGDIISVGNYSSIKLRFSGEGDLVRSMVLGQGTAINIVTNETGDLVPEVYRGKMYITDNILSALKDPAKEMNKFINYEKGKLMQKTAVYIPYGAIAVRGTIFSVEHDSIAGTTVYVTEGSILITGQSTGQSIQIDAGYKCSMNADGSFSGPIKLTENELDEWWKE